MAKNSKFKRYGALWFAVALLVPGTVLVAYSPTLYRIYCAATGTGASVSLKRQADAGPTASARPVNDTVTVYFDANVAPGLDWEFRPEKHKVVAKVGEPTKIYYYARNRSGSTGVARASFNVLPYKASPYFFKIQCFCFTRERLGAGESARMPVVFYVDEQMLKDHNLGEVHQLTLSYTMFAQNDLTTAEVKEARDLGAGSAKLDGKLKKARAVPFDNDAPRQ